MRVINFNFRPDTSAEAQERALEEISHWPAVSVAARLRPGAKNAITQRMAYVRVGDEAGVSNTLERLSHHPVVEFASIPAERHLLS